jgi:hypothetical protein
MNGFSYIMMRISWKPELSVIIFLCIMSQVFNAFEATEMSNIFQQMCVEHGLLYVSVTLCVWMTSVTEECVWVMRSEDAMIPSDVGNHIPVGTTQHSWRHAILIDFWYTDCSVPSVNGWKTQPSQYSISTHGLCSGIFSENCAVEKCGRFSQGHKWQYGAWKLDTG